MSVGSGKIPLLERKKVATMLISEALEGKYVKSSKGPGIIKYAEKRNDVYTEKGVYAYAAKVKPLSNQFGLPKEDFWTTVYVGVDE